MQHDIIEAYTGLFFCSLCGQEWPSYKEAEASLCKACYIVLPQGATRESHGELTEDLYRQKTGWEGPLLATYAPGTIRHGAVDAVEEVTVVLIWPHNPQ